MVITMYMLLKHPNAQSSIIPTTQTYIWQQPWFEDSQKWFVIKC